MKIARLINQFMRINRKNTINFSHFLLMDTDVLFHFGLQNNNKMKNEVFIQN